jgi:hypothetical protein
MHTHTTPRPECRGKLTLRDFTYGYDHEIGGQTYRCGLYMILVGRESYSVAYKGQTIGWGLESITEALRALEKHANGKTAGCLQRRS